jgi:catechol 2,3-dioxygenase-like lactoylglutathione lyase family enzyme
MQRNGIHHLTLTVTDADRSAAWYQALLGPATVILREGPGWRRSRMQWEDGLVIGATEHDATPEGDTFTHARVGLDHIGIGCPSEADVRAWADHIDALGFVRGPVEDVPYGWAVTARDPDGIAVEFFCGKQG